MALWKQFLLVCIGLGTFAASSARAEDIVTRGAQKSIQKGLAYLVNTQSDNGSWSCDIGYKLNYGYRTTKRGGNHVGVTALACMSFMANGNLPGRGRYGQVVEKGLQFVLRCVSDSGYITHQDSRMYSHAFATLFLAEMYGMTYRDDVRRSLKAAVDLIVKSQNDKGGWRYLPLAPDADMSITVCQVQALRAARNVGIRVPKQVVMKAIQYVAESANPDGSFKYQNLSLSRDSFPLTAAGLTAIYSTGLYSDEDQILTQVLSRISSSRKRVISGAIQYLKRKRYTAGFGTYFYFYGHYYGIQAMYIAGRQHFDPWYASVRDELVENQLEDGTWDTQVGPAFSTAMGTLILQIPYRYLPIFQKP
ncbi:MAG: terpene cyclase/mutase family protein [Planctomycetota bacterium]|jgi:hypothetical protein|nr:terpene cyclase/mutase family protein [Planctomycetota bacterium]